MSWDVLCFVAPPDCESVADMANDYVLPAIGSGDDIRDVIRHRCASVDIADPTWVRLSDPALYAEVRIAGDRPDGIVFFVPGGMLPGPLIWVIASDLGSRAYDWSTRDWIDDSEGADEAWKQFRDQNVADASN